MTTPAIHTESASTQSRLFGLLKRPVLSEKTTQMAEIGQYVFIVDMHANKIELAKAFEMAFPGRKVTQVRTINQKGHAKRVGRKSTVTSDIRKAVFTVTGEPIELFSPV